MITIDNLRLHLANEMSITLLTAFPIRTLPILLIIMEVNVKIEVLNSPQVCRDIDKSIAHTLQSILNTLDKDCDVLVEKIDEALTTDAASGKHNVKAYSWVGVVCK